MIVITKRTVVGVLKNGLTFCSLTKLLESSVFYQYSWVASKKKLGGPATPDHSLACARGKMSRE